MEGSLLVACCLLLVACCLLHVACCLLLVAYCLSGQRKARQGKARQRHSKLGNTSDALSTRRQPLPGQAVSSKRARNKSQFGSKREKLRAHNAKQDNARQHTTAQDNAAQESAHRQKHTLRLSSAKAKRRAVG
jgi:hypothetical protein